MGTRATSRTGSISRFGPMLNAVSSPQALLGQLSDESQGETTAEEAGGQLLDRLLRSFGEVAESKRAREVIQNEVKVYLRLKRKAITAEDIACIESRIRNVLVGGSPTRNGKVIYKRAVAEADEWARLYAFQDQLGEERDKERRKRQIEQRDLLCQYLAQQVGEQHKKLKEDSVDEAVYVRQQEADYKKWKEQEQVKEANQKKAMQQLKCTIESQLADRQAQKKLEAKLKMQEEQGLYAAMAAELKAKMEAESEASLKAKEELRSLLLSNEANKAIKEEMRLKDQALDRKYAREYAERLDKEEQARQEQIEKRSEYQTKQASLAQSLPESKRWIDPEIIDRNFKAREEAEEAQEGRRQQAAAAAKAALREQLAEQVAARKALRQQNYADLAVEQAALEQQIKASLEAEATEKAAVKAKREHLRGQLEAQLAEALQRKLTAEPAMTKTERDINADMLRMMHAAGRG